MSTIYILDANALVDMKKAIPTANQWDFFLNLAQRVEDGDVTIPSHVINEVGGPRVQHADMPGAWAKGMEDRIMHPLRAAEEYIAIVMTEVPDVLDHEADTEQADPWVLALALELTDAGHEVAVVTKDRKDRPGRISLRTACARFDVECCLLEDFLAAMSA